MSRFENKYPAGSIVEIELIDGSYRYGFVSKSGRLIAFLDVYSEPLERPILALDSDNLFFAKVSVISDESRWKKVGEATDRISQFPYPGSYTGLPGGTFTVYFEDGSCRPTTIDECMEKRFERSMVLQSRHVDRELFSPGSVRRPITESFEESRQATLAAIKEYKKHPGYVKRMKTP